MNLRPLLSIVVACVLALVSTSARAQDLHQAAKNLTSSDKEKVQQAVEGIGKSSDPAALALLEGLTKDSLRIDAAGTPFIAGEGDKLSPVFEGSGKPNG